MNKIAFLGAGSMAEAMISGLVNGNIVPKENIIAANRTNRERLFYLHEKYGIDITDSKEDLLKHADVVVLAMKPKDAAFAISSIKHLVGRQLIISVLAGITIQAIHRMFEKETAVIRAMPNTSAAIRMSATALSASKKVTMGQLKFAKHLFETIGMATVVKEQHLDAVTGLSGSGPAYIYYFIESMERAGAELGLDEKTAKDLILQTLAGASEMLLQSDKAPSMLRKEVTSPGGTTEAGIKSLEGYHFEEAIVESIKKAAERSKELRKLAGEPEERKRA
ncbi:pyrroline-5-carboxylate reductase [Metabacillus sp. GX 13764]|uniref:pyrroline-5-carboxylate reductase n=1 Tax=Metabacillus kandeliae TaxID=2900151 RepID=UPI001E560D26|nr:pyrroline-5-carboxylate reductase [Metabacillus kandeliae]MCD7033262.1 pyrroline-5-carboxylate reductase [Metabacillus kandeliae]